MQSEQHFGHFWYIWDNQNDKQIGQDGIIEGLVNLDAEKFNNEWERELEETKWERESKYFSWENLFCVMLDPRYKNIRLIKNSQEEIIRKFYDMRIDFLKKHNLRDKLNEYNECLLKENIIREETSIIVLNEINDISDFFSAEHELTKWLNRTKSLYNGGYTDRELFD